MRDTTMFAHLAGVAAEAIAAYFFQCRKGLLRPRNLFRGFLIVAGLAAAVTFGQSSPAPTAQTATPSTYTFSPQTIVNQISNKVSTELDSLATNSALTGFGQYVTAFFLGALMVWSSVKTMASGKGIGELLGEWVPLFVSFGVVYLFLDKTAGNLIVATMDSIGAAIGGANMSTVESAIRTAAEPVFKAIAAVVDQPRVTEAAGEGNFLERVAAGLATGLVSVVFKAITALILVFAGVLMVATVIMGFISVKLVLILAPVMVPFLMFRPMAWLFDSWLRFLLGACMLKIVVAFLLQVAAGLLSGMSALARQHYLEARSATPWETMQADILLLGMMLVFALLSMLLLMQAPGIATGLLSGSAGSSGFSGIKGLTQSVGNRVVTDSASATGARGAQIARNVGAARAGARHAKAGEQKDLRYRNPEAKAAYDRGYRNNQKPTSPGP